MYKKEKMLHELGQTYLKKNKNNFLLFCEEHRNLLFGYFEDYYYESIQVADFFEGEKKKKINLICQGLPLGAIGKQTSARSLTSNNDEEGQSSGNSDGMKGAFLASRKRLFIKSQVGPVTLETLIDQTNTNKSKNEINSTTELNFENELKDSSKRDDSFNSPQNTPDQNPKDDMFFPKNNTSEKNIHSRRHTNAAGINIKGNSPTEIKSKMIIPQISFNLKKRQSFFRQTSSKKILPQIPENELQLPTQKSFKFKKSQEEIVANPSLNVSNRSNSPEKKGIAPKIFIEIPKEKERATASLEKESSAKIKETQNTNLESFSNEGFNLREGLEKNVIFLILIFFNQIYLENNDEKLDDFHQPFASFQQKEKHEFIRTVFLCY